MKKALVIAVILGAGFALALGVHAALIASANGDGVFAKTARATCAACHGG